MKASLLLITGSLLITTTTATLAQDEKDMPTNQSMQENKRVVRMLYETSLNDRDFELIEDIIDEDYTGIRGGTGPAGFLETVRPIIEALPDIQWTIEDLIAEENNVVIRWSLQGTHTGTFRGYPPSQAQITNHGIAIYQLADGKITRVWIQTDRLGFLQQIGAIPQDL